MKLGWVLLVLVALWALDAALGLGAYWSHDLRHHHIPWRAWASGEWAAMRMPLWNPDVGSGFALTADGQTGAFYLPNMVLFGCLPTVWAVNLSVLGHTGWAAAGMLRLMDRLGVRGHGALLAAVAFAFSGFMSTHTGYLGMHNAAAWLPWLAAAAVSARWAPVAICAAMMAVAGHPQMAVIGIAAAGVVAAWAGNLRSYGAGLAVAVMASSPQWLATAELVGESMRDGGVSDSFSRIGALPVAELINGVLPRFFGIDRPADIAQTYFHRGDGYWGAGANHWDMSFYLGIPVVLLAFAGARANRFWVGLGAVSLLLMVGSPLWDALRLLPVFDSMRFPVRFSVALTLAVAVLAGTGVQRVTDHPHPRRLVRGLLAVAGALFAGLCAATAVFGRIRESVLTRLTERYSARAIPQNAGPLEQEQPAMDPASASERATQIVEGAAAALDPFSAANLLAIGLVLACAAVLWSRARGWLPKPWLGAAMVGLVYADLWAFGSNYNPRTPASEVDQIPVAVAQLGPELASGRIAVVDRRRHPDLDRELMSSNMGLHYGLSDALVPSPLMNTRHEAVLEKAGLDVGERGAHKWAKVNANLPLVQFLGVRWLFSEHAPSDPALTVRMTEPVFVVEQAAAMPRESLVWCTDIADDTLAALDELDPAVFAVVEEDVGLAECRIPMTDGALAVTTDVPHHRVLSVWTAAPALLVSAETHAPGWTATVDGVPEIIHRVNHAYRGVVVPPGEHQVEFRYRPEWLNASLPMAGVAWLVALVGLIRRETRTIAEE